LLLTFPATGQLPGQGSSDGLTNTASFSIGSIQGSCISASAHQSCTTGGLILNPGQTFTLPFTLGQTFSFNYTASNNATANFNNGTNIGGTFAGTLSFSVREANGTVVALSEVPDPAIWSLVLLLPAGLLLNDARRRRFRH
jgi:hypothetical protein